MNNDLISRSALLKRLELVDMDKSTDFRAGVQFGVEHAIDVVKEVPAADVAPVVHGEWIWNGKHWECSNCRRDRLHDLVLGLDAAYCPHCGAKMDGERKGDDELSRNDKF